MNSLTDLKEAFLRVGIKVESFNGMFMETEHGRWGMAMGQYYLNGNQVSKKELKKLIGEVK